MAMEPQPARSDNIDALVNYFKSGIKDKAETIGIELEHTLVHENGDAVSFSETHGQMWLLEQLEDGCEVVQRGTDGRPIGLFKSDASVTLEPAAQLEFSAGPFASLEDAKKRFELFRKNVEGALADTNIQLLTPGYHPTTKAADLELIPKSRYHIMNEYLGSISMYGICMMRGSAATQVAIDYTSVDDCLRKLRLANCLVPVLSLICDNSPVFEGKARSHPLVRTEIWEKCDPARCTGVPGVAEPDFTLERYAEYILNTPAMVDSSTGKEILSEQTFGQIFAEKVMSTEDIEHALSVFFTDVRLKNYIEIRPADAMPIDCAIAYAAIIKGLFYNKGSLNALDELLVNVRGNNIRAAKKALMRDGYNALVYGHPVSELADEIISIAGTGLDESERKFLEPLAALVSRRVTLAEIALEEMGQ